MTDQDQTLADRAREARAKEQDAEARQKKQEHESFLSGAVNAFRAKLGVDDAELDLATDTWTTLKTVDARVDGLFVRYASQKAPRQFTLLYPCPRCGERGGESVGDFGTLAALGDLLDRMEHRPHSPKGVCFPCADADARKAPTFPATV